MTQKIKRPEFVNGVRVRMPEDYDFSTFGMSIITEARTGVNTTKITNSELMQYGRKIN